MSGGALAAYGNWPSNPSDGVVQPEAALFPGKKGLKFEKSGGAQANASRRLAGIIAQ
jgi:hypothetical protein